MTSGPGVPIRTSGPGVPTIVQPFAAGVTSTATVAWLLAACGSVCEARASALRFSLPASPARTTAVTVSEWPRGRSPSVHVRAPAVQLPGPVAETRVAPAGRMPFSRTDVASAGPSFVTVAVRVTVPPAARVVWSAVRARPTSALVGSGLTFTLTLAEEFEAFGSASAAAAWAETVKEPLATLASGVRARSTDAWAPLASAPSGHVTVDPVTAQAPPGPDGAELRLTPAGSVAVSVPPVAADGPRSATANETVTGLPASTAVAEAVPDTARSAAGLTVAEACAWSLPLTGSASLPETVAVSVRDEPTSPAPGETTRVIVAVPETASVPRLQVTVEAPEQVPWLLALEARAGPAGRASVRVTPVAGDGPRFWTVTV